MRTANNSTIKTILEALKEQYDPGDAHPATPTDPSLQLPLRALRRTRLSLSPLFFIEANLLKILSPESLDSRDMAVRAGNGWRELLWAKSCPSPTRGQPIPGHRPSQNLINSKIDPSSVLVAQREEIISLWNNPDVQGILKRRRPRLRESPGL